MTPSTSPFPSLSFSLRKISARFGHSLALLGDSNGDGVNDVAIGAPFPGSSSSQTSDPPPTELGGAVFIFHGSSAEGLASSPSQIIRLPASSSSPSSFPSSSSSTSSSPSHSFGFSLVGGRDLDGNGYPDLVVGDIGNDAAFLFWAAPPAEVEEAALIVNQGKAINLEVRKNSLPL